MPLNNHNPQPEPGRVSPYPPPPTVVNAPPVSMDPASFQRILDGAHDLGYAQATLRHRLQPDGGEALHRVMCALQGVEPDSDDPPPTLDAVLEVVGHVLQAEGVERTRTRSQADNVRTALKPFVNETLPDLDLPHQAQDRDHTKLGRIVDVLTDLPKGRGASSPDKRAVFDKIWDIVHDL